MNKCSCGKRLIYSDEINNYNKCHACRVKEKDEHIDIILTGRSNQMSLEERVKYIEKFLTKKYGNNFLVINNK